MAINRATLGIWDYDMITGHFSCSEHTRRILGLSAKMEINLTLLHSMCHSEDLIYVRELIASSLVDNKPFDVECRVVRSDGEIRWILISARTQLNDAGFARNLSGMIYDVTERRTAFEQLQQQEILLKDKNLELEALYECMPLGIAHMDRSLRFLRVNERLAAINGKSVEEHIGRSLHEVVPRLSVDLENIYRSLYDSGQPIRDVEISGTSPTEPHSTRHWLVNFYPVRLHNGDLKGACAVVLDITTRKLAENAILATSLRLKHLNQRLMNVEEEVKRKIAQELHDQFGQTLTGLKLMIEAILEGSSNNSKYASNALSLVIQLISQTRTLSLNLRPPMLDDFGLIATLTWFCEDYYAKTHIHVNFEHNGIAARRFPSEVEIVAFRLVQEGLTNIARHAKTAQAELQVGIREDNLSIELTDDGVGFTIPDSPNWGESHGGLLGMHERAESIGGHLKIDSSSGKGTRIQAILPLGAKALAKDRFNGTSKSVDTYELLAASSKHPRERTASLRKLTPLVGREGEIEAFHQLLQQTGMGRGRILAMVGEAGMGKSRLVHEFTRHQLPLGWLVLEGSSASFGKATPYFPLIEMLRGYFRIHHKDGKKEIQKRAVMQVTDLDSTLKPIIPPLLSLLSALPNKNKTLAPGRRDLFSDDPELVSMVNRFNALDPQQRRRDILDAIKKVLIRESQRQPLVLVCEDLHWIDTETQAFLDRLVQSLPLTRILLLVDYRPSYSHSWSELEYYAEVRVSSLEPANAEKLLQHLLGSNADLIPFKKTLVERTVGNPFFAEESVRSLVEAGVLVGERGAYRPELSINEVRIASTVQDLISSRIDRLSSGEKRILQIASVIGVLVPFTLLRAAAEIGEEDLRSYLSHLQTAEFLYQTNLFPEVEYSFKHAITCEVAYGELVNDVRTFWHRRVLEALESTNQPLSHDYIEKLAYHAFIGEVWDKAVRYLKEAGDAALSRSSFRNAVLQFDRALDALEHLPRSSENLTRAIDLRFDARNALFVVNDFKRGLEHLQKSKEIAVSIHDEERLGKILTWMTAHWNLAGNSEQAIVTAKEALKYTSSTNGSDSKIVAHNWLGVAHYNLGQFKESINELEIVLSLIPEGRQGDFFGTPVILSVNCKNWLIRSLAQIGAFDTTSRYGEEAIQTATDRAHPLSVVFAYYAVGATALLRGEFNRAIAALEHALEVCQAAEIPVQRPLVVCALSAAYAFVDRIDEAILLLESTTGVADAMNRVQNGRLPLGKSMGMVWEVETYRLGGKCSEATTLAHRFLKISIESKDKGSEAWIRCLIGDLLTSTDTSTSMESEASYRHALSIALELGMRPLQARCHLGLGQFYACSGNITAAQSEFRSASALYHDISMPYWAQKSDRSLASTN
jgi:PAS domain S-box-containing protein